MLTALMLALAAASPPPARAALRPCELTSVTPVGSGGQARIELACDLVGRGASIDRVTIVSRSARADRPASWPEIADTDDAVWIFDYLGDKAPELVIDFHHDGRSLIADLFDSRGDPRRLDPMIRGVAVPLTTDRPPTVRVVAPDGWWQRGDRVNFDLHVFVDGLMDAAFDMRAKLRGHIDTDGTVDFTIKVLDEDDDGRPDYDWRTVRHPPTQPRALQLTFLTVNVRDDEPPLAPVWPWPYLGDLSYGYLTTSPHVTSEPPIQIDWRTGTLEALGEFVSSRGNDGQWFINSYQDLAAGESDYANFENPFAWYDLADDRDGQAELAVRQVYYDPNDPLFVRGNYTAPINIIRYSWDQDNDDYWDYKLGLLGDYPVTSTVTVDGVNIATIPYDEFPHWVTDRRWAVATFVTAEGVRARGEGIYRWDPSTWLTERYYTGFSDTPWRTDGGAADENDIDHIPDGYRGEYQLNLADRVALYLSPIDRKLHLRKAEDGFWNIDGTAQMQYGDLDGDGYFDQWQYLVGGELQRQLSVSGPYLVYSTPDEVIIKRADVPDSVWEGTPPADHTAWSQLGEKLRGVQPDLTRLSPRQRLEVQTDLRAMMGVVDGPSVQIQGATARHIRPDGQGFRFVLELDAGYQVTGSDLLGLQGRQPGTYLVTFGPGFRLRPLTGAVLSLDVHIPQGGDLQASLPVAIHVNAANAGLDDAPDLMLVAEARRAGRMVEFARQDLALLAGRSQVFELTWSAGAAGNWDLEVSLRLRDGTMLAKSTQSVSLKAGTFTSPQAVVAASSSDGWRLPAYAMLAALASVIVIAVRHADRRVVPEAD